MHYQDVVPYFHPSCVLSVQMPLIYYYALTWHSYALNHVIILIRSFGPEQVARLGALNFAASQRVIDSCRIRQSHNSLTKYFLAINLFIERWLNAFSINSRANSYWCISILLYYDQSANSWVYIPVALVLVISFQSLAFQRFEKTRIRILIMCLLTIHTCRYNKNWSLWLSLADGLDGALLMVLINNWVAVEWWFMTHIFVPLLQEVEKVNFSVSCLLFSMVLVP
jgi:hypothetical protein